MRAVTGLVAGLLLCEGNISVAQQDVSPSRAAAKTQVTLDNVVRNLPNYVGTETSYSEAIENATSAERDAALPLLMQWISDDRPQVKAAALLAITFLYGPSEKRPGPLYSTGLPVRYIPAVVERLRDPDPRVRNTAFLALQTVEYSGNGLDELTELIVPMLREPDILTEYPDPFFIEAEKRMLAGMTAEQQAAFKAMPRKVFKLPAEGTLLLAFLAGPRQQPSKKVDDAMIVFLDREDQTKSTLAESLHTLALSRASERVNDEALRQIFEHKAMTIFLLQFVTWLRLTPEQLTAQRERLLALSNDGTANPALRRSARDVAECWSGDRHAPCRPSDKDLSEQVDTR